jgi:uncharacterized membrane protein
MLGFIIGGIAAIGLIKLVRRHHAPFGCAGYYGPGFGAVRRGFGPRSMLRMVFERLRTTPGQERAIVAALERLRENRSPIRDEIRQTRDDVASTVEGGLMDDAMLDETFHRHDRLLAQVRVSWVEALKTISETLDERQRKELASLIRGRHFFGRGWWSGLRDFHSPVAEAWDL